MKIILYLLRFYFRILFYINPVIASKQAITLYSTPFPKRKFKGLCAQMEYSVDHLLFNGKSVNIYKYKGTGQTILLVHGWGSNVSDFNGLVSELLKNDYSIILFDAPAHGLTAGKTLNIGDYRDLISVILNKYDSIDIVIGHSLGGVASSLSLAKSKRLLKKMFLICPPSNFPKTLVEFCSLLHIPHYRIDNLYNYIQSNLGFSMLEMDLYNVPRIDTIENVYFLHDKNDKKVSIQETRHMINMWGIDLNHLLVTEGLGHNRILNDSNIHQWIINNI